ncbi:MAG: hypothetical protein J1F03_03495 [Oscillospiraceae bacterium]|nr:hypothetical protein [Oscillospiraceae bacterium]
MKLKEYEVLYVEYAENTVYICRRPLESKLYRVIESADRERIAKYIKYFVINKPREFYEDFCLNQKYYAVFCVSDGITVQNAGETLTAQKVVRALAMQNPPLEIAVKILSPDHIYVCGDELEFAYDLPEIDLKITWEYFFVKLYDFINLYCETGADQNYEKWLEKLQGGKFEDLINAYRCMPNTAEAIDIAEMERFKKIKEVLPKIIAVIAAAAAIITAAAFILDRSSEDIGYSRIDSLGTIDLTEQ